MKEDRREERMINFETGEAEIKFSDYAPVDKDYTKEELAEIYKKIMTDIAEDKR